MRFLLLTLLAGAMFCHGCTIAQQERAAISRLGEPSLSTIFSGDTGMLCRGIDQEFLQYRDTWRDSTRWYYYLDKYIVVTANSDGVAIATMDPWQCGGVRATLERMSQHHSTPPAPVEE